WTPPKNEQTTASGAGQPLQLLSAGSHSTDREILIDAVEGKEFEDGVRFEVRVANFTSAIGAQFSVQWNAEALEFGGLDSFGLPGLSIENFGRPAPGALTFCWDDPAGAGVSLPDGSVLFAISFKK